MKALIIYKLRFRLKSKLKLKPTHIDTLDESRMQCNKVRGG